jgi:hypothetical protein
VSELGSLHLKIYYYRSLSTSSIARWGGFECGPRQGQLETRSCLELLLACKRAMIAPINEGTLSVVRSFLFEDINNRRHICHEPSLFKVYKTPGIVRRTTSIRTGP